MKTSLSLGRLKAFILGITLSSVSYADPLITDVTLTDTQVILTFEENGPNNQFQLERNPNLDPTNWSTDASASLSPLVNGVRTYTLSRNAADKEFFRVIGSMLGTAADPDGDGIPTALEDLLNLEANGDPIPDTDPRYFDPTKFDTDGDGFSDGFEHLSGTNPNDASSTPVDIRTLPSVEFVDNAASRNASIAAAKEGEPSYSLSLTSTPPYSGTIHYQVNARSTATSGIDFQPLAGTVTMSSGSATIPLTVIDDLTIEKTKLLIVDILPDASGTDYVPRGAISQVICIEDNDAYWSGMLIDAKTNLERSFRVCIAKDSLGNINIEFRSGTSDGLIALSGSSASQSTGVIPAFEADGTTAKELWPSDPFRFFSYNEPNPNDNVFYAIIENLPVDTGGDSAQLVRSLTLAAGPNSGIFGNTTDNLIAGEYYEAIRHATDSSITYLDRDCTGTFTLVKDVAAAPEVNNPLVPPAN